MPESRTEFKKRLARIPKRQVSQTYNPYLDSHGLSSDLSPLGYVFAGVMGFVLFLVLPHVFLSFAGPGADPRKGVDDAVFDLLWTLPSIGLAFAASIVFLSVVGFSSGGHLKAACIGIGLGLGLVLLLPG